MSHRAIQRVLTEYETWASPEGAVPDGLERSRQRISILLYARADYLEKDDPTYWRSGDVHELLIQYCAPRQVDAWDLATHAPADVRNFLRFLDETSRLHPASTRADTLLKELDRLTPKFAAAMADTSRWRLAKRVFTTMIADGVDIADETAADLWAEKFSALDARARRQAMGELIDSDPHLSTAPMVVHDGQVALLAPGGTPCKHLVWQDARCTCGECDARARAGAYPAVKLPGDSELAQEIATRGSAQLRRMIEFVDWIGTDGRPVDNHGELTRDQVRDAATVFGVESASVSRLRQVPGLSQLWRFSLEFGILELRRTRVIPGPDRETADRVLRGDATSQEALALWCGLYDKITTPLREITPRDPDAQVIFAWLTDWPTRFLDHLYARPREAGPAEFSEIMTEVLDELADRIPHRDTELYAEMAGMITRVVLSHVAGHGGVELAGDTAADPPPDAVTAALHTVGLEPVASRPASGLRVQLTDLGRYAIRQQLLADGVTAPLADDLSG